MKPKSTAWRTLTILVLATALIIPGASARQPDETLAYPAAILFPADKTSPEPSGIYDFRDIDLGISITECPQAGLQKAEPEPLDRRQRDEVERISRNTGQESKRDIRVNQDFSCFAQDETSIDVNPQVKRNIVVGANDYRLGTGSSGFYASTDGGASWYDGIIPFPSVPAALSRGEGFVPSGGDPVIAFDRDGIVYYAQIAFFRGNDTNGVFVQRSTNGGFTWSRGCVPVDTTPTNPNDDEAACGGVGDPRQPGDGRVTFNPDNDAVANGSVPFDDKEWMTAGPRPSGVQATCFTPITRTAQTCDPDVVGVDRLYVTWTRFEDANSQIYVSYSDDRARSWSPPRSISGSGAFCVGGSSGGCDNNQASVPTVNPTTGYLYVAFLNGNTPDENQYLTVRSQDGGSTFQGPFFVTPVYDINFPRAGNTRPDCTARGQQGGRVVYTNSCFRSNPYGNIVVDRRGGAFANDLYLVMSDNRNGTGASSNADIFLFKSIDGGTTWVGPTRVNDDRSVAPPDRDCGRPAGSLPDPNVTKLCGIGDFGNDQWWPWVDIGEQGALNITFHDRRLDTSSTAHEWPSSRSRPGNYLVWQWGVQCRITASSATPGQQCVSAQATTITQPTGPVDPGAGPQPGQNQSSLPLRNFQTSDVPSNFDYSFRAGIFAGDYENIAVEGDTAYATWTDARNGRSSRNQPGRNPLCEQSDVFMDMYSATHAQPADLMRNISPFLVTPCPSGQVDPQRDRHNDD